MFRYVRRFTSPKIFANITKWSTSRSTSYNKVLDSKIGNWCFGISGFCGIFHVHAQRNKSGDLTEHFEEEIRRATLQGEKYLAQLMRVLRFLILQTSVEYQECLIKQIEITRESTKIGPVGEHWDKLTMYRVKGNDLKDELYKYEALAMSIADIVHLEVQSSLAIGNEIVLKVLNGELEKLQKLCTEQLQEIHKYEAELLAANRDSILHGVRSK